MRLLLLALLAAPLIGAADIPAPPEFAGVRAYIQQGIARGLAPATSIAVLREGRVVWAEGFGYADLVTKRRATSDTIYSLASVSKPLTATALMTLVEKGALDLDRPVNDYLPGVKLRSFAGDPKEITIRRLANHTAGLPTHYNFFYPGSDPPDWNYTIGRYGFAFVAPGTRQEYSNLAFGLLAYVTEQVSRIPREEYLESTVFKPLGMTRTSDHPGDADRAIPYRMDAGAGFLRSAPYAFDHPGASVYWSTVNDLARFVRMHLGDGEVEGVRILKPESARAMRTPVRESQPAEGFSEGNLSHSRFGIGWGVERYLGHECFWHSGGMPGVSNMVRVFPENGSAVIVLTNTDDRTMAREAALAAARVLLSEPTAPMYPPAESVKPEPGAFYGTWAGTLHHFSGDIPVRLTLRAANAEIAFGKRGTLPVSDTSFGQRYFTGTVDAFLETRPDYHGVAPMVLRLWREGNRLTGFAMQTMNGYFALSSYLELTRPEDR